MSRRLTWSLLLGAALSLAIVIASNEQDPIADLLRRDSSSLLVKAALVAFAVGIGLAVLRRRLSKVFEAALIWFAIGLMLVIGYTYRFEMHDAVDRVLAELIPGRVVTHGHTVEVVRGHRGDFAVSAHINGAHVSMVLDTGASSVVLTRDAAKAAGLPIEVLNYSVNVETANGVTRAAPVTLDRIAVGGVTERSVPALVAQAGQLKKSLLGMSFLNRLESWEVHGDKLRLRGGNQ